MTTQEYSSTMKQQPLRSTSKYCINAERQLIEEADNQCTQQAALFAEAALEMGSSMDTTGDTFYDHDNSCNNATQDPDNDDDNSSGDDDEPRCVHLVEDNLFSAYVLLHLNSSFKKHCHDQQTRAIHHANMYHVWNLQLPILADAYLHWKHIEFQPVHAITQHNEEAANTALVHVGLLGCSPTVPSVAITLQCLEFYHQLRWHQSYFSIQAFTKVLCALHDVTYVPTFQEQFSDTFDIYLTILHEIRSCTDTALGQTELNWHLCHSCPACTFKQPDEPTLYLESLKAMDGNNSAKRMTTAGHTDHCKFMSHYMITSEDIDAFKDDVHLHPGEWGTDSDANNPLACTDNWKAANSTNKNTVSVFEQTGIFLSACRHGMIQTITEMRHSGELVKYPLATINKLLDIFGHNQAIGTDIGCSLAKTVAASSIHDKAADHQLLLAVNAFHGYAHNRKCQLRHHPLYLGGFGLKDLETCEQIFAGSNAAASLIQHVSHFHYVQYLDLHFDQWDTDKYLELSHFIFNNYRQVLTIIADDTKELEVYCIMYPDEVLDFDSWIDEELAYLLAVGSEPQHDALTAEYVDALEKLAKYENAFNSSHQDQFVSYNQLSFTPNSGLSISAAQATKQGHAACRATEHQLQVQINVIEDLEVRLGVSERWTPDHEEYVKALEYSHRWHFIFRLFELLKANLALTGYKLQKQISKAIVKRSSAIHTALDNEVVSYAVLGEFDLLKYSRHEILTKPWMNPTHHEMAVKHFKVLHAREEIIRLNVEICRLQAWVVTEDADME
ncbi:uncharacterized protein EDB91DRAFT_1085831 [Suillus paluster]|uniref:uncharacterized protein n=1 Tax=Suillus paluster TaxID=48578 RepID=UPI001B86A441|nr:uncharacterized protein EDB91DRAFT_1085831 [Suillus paluster]KAG1729220.1 hypothetical protein EDB91DRAFT_1085831 [Suillus paluster]